LKVRKGKDLFGFLKQTMDNLGMILDRNRSAIGTLEIDGWGAIGMLLIPVKDVQANVCIIHPCHKRYMMQFEEINQETIPLNGMENACAS
jgi:hypothetical protein